MNTNPFTFLFPTDSSTAIDTLLDLEAKSHVVFSSDPNLHNLSRILSSLPSLIDKLHKHRSYFPRSLLQHLPNARYPTSQVPSYPKSKSILTASPFAISSTCCRSRRSLINFIRSPLVDEILCRGKIPKVIGFLRLRELGLPVATLECILELEYIRRRVVVEAMVKEGVIEILMDLQREGCSKCECDLAFGNLITVLDF
ncbi:hypothetical protein LR48_Vigan08g188400 [Vigna angularis]|uniref:Uncharacterized protein n=1 Tax=Phaseolus angularis TaxID=3914 RepID=A0A0L9V837_PHAAN|nr:hypothetical protein LR48_Vigan08g188400 [Vigna angularis]